MDVPNGPKVAKFLLPQMLTATTKSAMLRFAVLPNVKFQSAENLTKMTYETRSAALTKLSAAALAP